MLAVLFWWVAFGGTHTALSHPPVRRALISRLGSRPFPALYSIVAFATFIPLVRAYFGNRETVSAPLGVLMTTPGLHWLTLVIMIPALVMLVSAFTVPNPVAIGQRTDRPQAVGILRVTRHPLFMALALFGLAHLLSNSTPIDVAFFGGFVVYGVLGSAHQDARKLAEGGEGMQRYFEETSLLPFGAILAGRNRLVVSELGVVGPGIGIALFLVLFLTHHRIF